MQSKACLRRVVSLLEGSGAKPADEACLDSFMKTEVATHDSMPLILEVHESKIICRGCCTVNRDKSLQ